MNNKQIFLKILLVIVLVLATLEIYRYECKDEILINGILNYYMPLEGYVKTNYVNTRINEIVDTKQVEYISITTKEEKDNQENGEKEKSLIDISTLQDFNRVIDTYYTIPSITQLTKDKFDVNKALQTDYSMQQDNSKPQILIFHTHSQEEFKDSDSSRDTSIVAVGEELARILSIDYGYNVIHDISVYDYVNGVLDRSKAYTYAEAGIEKILKENPSIEVVLDIHRDGVDESNHLVTQINGKDTAKIMFFNGISYTKVKGNIDYLKNPYIQDNLGMSLQMQLLGNTYYPGLLRKIYINGYRYCLHYRAKSMLIEVGAQNNTLEEEKNAMVPLADMLNRLFKGEKAYK